MSKFNGDYLALQLCKPLLSWIPRGLGLTDHCIVNNFIVLPARAICLVFVRMYFNRYSDNRIAIPTIVFFFFYIFLISIWLNRVKKDNLVIVFVKSCCLGSSRFQSAFDSILIFTVINEYRSTVFAFYL